jgi:hypothetical protein
VPLKPFYYYSMAIRITFKFTSKDSVDFNMFMLSLADVESLVASGLASPVSENGIRRVHTRLLNRSSDQENTHLPLSAISGTTPAFPESPFSTIPEAMISLATLKYLGYNDETAQQLCDYWNQWPKLDKFTDYPHQTYLLHVNLHSHPFHGSVGRHTARKCLLEIDA